MSWTNDDEDTLKAAQRERAEAQAEATHHTNLKQVALGEVPNILTADAIRALGRQRKAMEAEHALWRRKRDALYVAKRLRPSQRTSALGAPGPA